MDSEKKSDDGAVKRSPKEQWTKGFPTCQQWTKSGGPTSEGSPV